MIRKLTPLLTGLPPGMSRNCRDSLALLTFTEDSFETSVQLPFTQTALLKGPSKKLTWGPTAENALQNLKVLQNVNFYKII